MIIEKKFDNISPLFKRILSAIFYSLFGTAGAKVLQLICQILISRTIGQDAYGQFSMINSTVSLFVLFAGAGVEATLTRYISLYRNQSNKIGKIGGTIIIGVIMFAFLVSMFLFIFSNTVSMWSCGEKVLGNYFKITAATVLFTVIAAVFRSFLIGLENYKNVAFLELFSTIIYVLTSTLLTRTFGIIGAIASLGVLHLIRLICFGRKVFLYCRENKILLHLCYDREIIDVLLKFTLPAFVASIFVIPVNWFVNSLITKSFGFSEMAIYSVAMQWKTFIIYIPTQMNQLRPIYADLYGKRETKKLNKLLFKSSVGSFGIVLPFVLMGIFFRHVILSFYGAHYVNGRAVFSIIMLTMIPYSLQMQIGSYLQAIGKMWIGLFLNVVWALVYTGTAYLFIGYGAVGFAFAFFSSYTIHCILSVLMVVKIQRSDIYEKIS